MTSPKARPKVKAKAPAWPASEHCARAGRRRPALARRRRLNRAAAKAPIPAKSISDGMMMRLRAFSTRLLAWLPVSVDQMAHGGRRAFPLRVANASLAIEESEKAPAAGHGDEEAAMTYETILADGRDGGVGLIHHQSPAGAQRAQFHGSLPRSTRRSTDSRRMPRSAAS